MTSEFERNLQKYADLAVKIGLNPRPGQRLVIGAPIYAAPLIRLITASAYQAGVRLVDVLWDDEQIELARYRFAPRDSFEEFPEWRAKAMLEYAERGDARLAITSRDPELLKDQDPELVAKSQKVAATQMRPVNELVIQSAMNWLGIGVPSESWAAKVFPNEAPERQVARLWETIFEVCRVNLPDPIAAWEEHIARLAARSEYLNHKQYTALHYTGPGTDLTIGLPDKHRWKSASDTTRSGIVFVPNIPTEEVFTMPHRERTNGVVTASKPLNLRGALIENFRLTFRDGRVVDVAAESGETVLRKMIETDEGASRLGEVALVPHSSPIAQSGLLFYNTLFDENAASHIALGFAFPFNLQNGDELSEEEFVAAGGNRSLMHVDFMIGSDRMDIDGMLGDGTTEPVMRGGEWAFAL
jgi:aminopeptidase